MIKPWPLAFAAAFSSLLVFDAQAADPRYLPPPGLYEFTTTTDQTSFGPDGKTSHDRTVVGTDGAHDVRYRNEDGHTGRYGVPGAGRSVARTCVPASKPGAIPPQMLAGGCVGKPAVVQGDRMVSTASCPWGKMTLSMRRVDAKTWENVVEEERNGVRGGDTASSLAPIKAMLQQQLKTGSPKERAEAREALADLEQEIRDEAAARAEDAQAGIDDDAGAAAELTRRTRAVIRMTRIAETCK